MVEVREITSSSAADLDLLRRYHTESFKLSFPGFDERDVEDYFHRDQRGDFGADKYHVVVATYRNELLGGSVSAYLAEPNAGVIEYQNVNVAHRGSGIAADIYLLTERILEEDAKRAGRELDMLVAEIEDPFRTPLPTSFDRFRRAGILHYTGYSIADYPHIQRLLDVPGQEGLHTLLLLAKPLSPEFVGTVPPDYLKMVLDAYFSWGELSGPSYDVVMEYLSNADKPIELVSLSDYVCNDDSTAPVENDEITQSTGPQIQEVIDEYTAAFTESTAAISPGQLRAELGLDTSTKQQHVWSIRRRDATACEGIASFVAAPSAGFARYLGLTPPVRGRDALIHLCSRIEKQMILDAAASHGWYVQCAGEAERDILLSPDVGFHELDVPFTRIAGPMADRKAAHLLYKSFGRAYEPPQIPVADFLTSMQQILTLVDGSGDDGCYPRLEQHLAGRDTVPVTESHRK
jgi:hypothetical protein